MKRTSPKSVPLSERLRLASRAFLQAVLALVALLGGGFVAAGYLVRANADQEAQRFEKTQQHYQQEYEQLTAEQADQLLELEMILIDLKAERDALARQVIDG